MFTVTIGPETKKNYFPEIFKLVIIGGFIKTPVSTRVFIFLSATIVIQSLSFLSMKIAATYSVYQYYALAFAFVFFALRAYLWQLLLKVTPLSKIYPYASLVQVIILAYAVLIFHETVTLNNILGLGVMISGLFLIFYDSKKS